MNLQAIALVKEYDRGVRALGGVSLAAAPGEAIAVTGPSGSGKSTLLSLLGGLEAPTAGRVEVDGSPLSSLRPLHRFRAQRVGMVFQFHHLLPHLTLRENVEIPMLSLGLTRRTRRLRVSELLERLGLEGREDSLPARVSGGERQRCAVARALVNGPELVLADEPTGNLDTDSGAGVVDLLLEWSREKAAILIVATHDPEVARRVDRRLRLRDGRVAEAGEGVSGPDDASGPRDN